MPLTVGALCESVCGAVREIVMTKFGVILVGLSLIAGSAVAETRQFDLACTGTKVVQTEQGKAAPVQWSRSLRVDLDKGLWCDDLCKAPTTISLVMPTKIVLTDDDNEASDFRMLTTLNRTNGTLFHSILHGHPSILETDEATCVVQPFSGMPTRAF